MHDVLIRPIAQVAGDAREQGNVKHAFLDAVVDAAVRIQGADLGVFAGEVGWDCDGLGLGTGGGLGWCRGGW